jgi:hypothetical protein
VREYAQWDGLWAATRVSHRIDSGGWSITLELEAAAS